jgi:tripartite-type tricarboxylate transporter receptor subunit TctC
MNVLTLASRPLRPLKLFAGLATLAFSACVAAQAYPDRPVRLIVPYPAGGATDQLARLLQQPLAEALRQPVIVDNRGGAGGSIGIDMAAKATPDGYTIVFGNTGPLSILPVLRKNMPYDALKDFDPISAVADTPMILAVTRDAPVKSVADFIAWSKAKPQGINFGSVGAGSISHLTGESFKQATSTHLTHIPYTGGAQMMTGFAGNFVDAVFAVGLDLAPLVAADRVRTIAVATPARTEAAAGLPTIAETVPGFRAVATFGLLAPKGTPPEIIARLNKAIVEALSVPAMKRIFREKSADVHPSTPAEYGNIIREEMNQWRAVAQSGKVEM